MITFIEHELKFKTVLGQDTAVRLASSYADKATHN